VLLKAHVRWLPDNSQSRVDYAGFQRDRAALKQVLDTLAPVPKADFRRLVAPSSAWPS
jgi:hypothetical protein